MYDNYSTLNTSASASDNPLGNLFGFVVLVLALAGLWKMFTKAGKPGWAAIVPFYNLYVWLKIAGRPGWWLILFFIPILNIIMALVVALDLAKAFGKSPVFGVVGLWLFSVVGYLILGFGKATYVGPNASPAPAPAAPPAAPAQ